MRLVKETLRFWLASAREALTGGPMYYLWLLTLVVCIAPGLWAYAGQAEKGLAVTGMSDQVTWGVYIANFTYLVGMAAAAVMLVIPAYIFHNEMAKRVVVVGEVFAATACMMALMFVMADLGHPERGWHLIPVIGRLNWPMSIMAWDVIVLTGYLVINICIPGYLLFKVYHRRPAHDWWFGGAVVLAIFWAIGIHTVTAFLYSAASGRHFWASALLGPRFLASAFAAGPAFILLTFRLLREATGWRTPKQVMRLLSIIIAVALQINLFMLGAEIFTELYSPTHHSSSARYLFLGLDGHDRLVPWITTAISLEVIAVVILSVRPLRKQRWLLGIACVFCCVGVWIEKGMGLIVPGFVPTQIGEILEYGPTVTETVVSLSIWAVGALIFTLLVKPTIAISQGSLLSPALESEGGTVL